MKFKEYRALLLDGDGVLWKADQPLPGVQELFNFLAEREIPWALLTNNNGHPVGEFIDRFTQYGIQAGRKAIFTSSTVTADYLQEKYGRGASLYVIGMQGLIEALEEAGFEIALGEDMPRLPASAVVAGMDLDLNYQKIITAMRLILDGADFVATNTDRNYPRPDGIYPATGVVTGAIQGATGVEPYVVGKPYPAIFKAALEELGAAPEETLMVGDQLDTDILGANQAGIDSALVLTGVTTRQIAADSPIKPTFIFEDIPALLERLKAAS
ncbi:MAG: HAD-IIA family hydrolase [Anaerolineales bacterium]|jgi:4-nitrophenyl phosphatase